MEYNFKYLNRKKTDSIKWKIAQNLCDSEDCFDFSIADSDYETAPEIKKAMIERITHGAFGYISIGDDYKKILIDFYNKHYGLNISENQIIPIPRVMNGISVILDLFLEKKESVIIQTPVYPAFRHVIEANGLLCITNELIELEDTYEMNYLDLEDKFKNRIKTLIICNPHNPVGRVWRYEELEKLINLAKKYDVLIISDEIHADIIMPGYEFVSLANFFSEYQNIIILNAPSKTFNLAGLQLANLLTPKEYLLKKITFEYERLHLSTPNLMALVAMEAAYKQGRKWLLAQREHVYGNYLLLKSKLEDFKLKVFKLEGTYLVWIKIEFDNIDSTILYELLMKSRVIVSDGKKFESNGSFIRFNLACSREQLQVGLNIIIDCLKKIKTTEK
ncbi:MAG: aminotransferase class I/II-fold pyridoxal phosphate-dependent enzyme [Candidatus Izemoplasmatales bacterium]